ncbi:MAG TPA: sugar phosphate isomerase/epimerase family protein [Candidatus Deferrimicrobiaceae bacterium]|nr:sugar phosphate isomerase/epimerase family protein [Candidatus Deferrimicrobiaceae bacterium]
MVSSAKSCRELKDAAEIMEFSLSTHLFVFRDLDESVVSLFPEFGFPSAELWAMPPHFPYADPTAAGEIASRLSLHGVRVASLHAPLYPDVRSYKKDRWYSLSSEDESHRIVSVEATAAAGAWLARNGGGTVVLHTNFPAENWYPRRWGAFLSSLNELLEKIPGNVRFALENTPLSSGRLEIVMDIADRYPEERIGVCLDLGHAHIGGDVKRAIRDSAPRLTHVHASDNHGDRDDHLVPGRGTIPWKEVFAELEAIGFPGPFIVELRDYTRGDDPPYRSFGEMLAECRIALEPFAGEGGRRRRWMNGQSG